MEDKNCTIEQLINLHHDRKLNLRDVGKVFGVHYTVISRWLKENNIEIKIHRDSIYTINNKFFERIDTEEKAYWLGFIWCDGYIGKRDRNGNGFFEYWFELTLNIFDKTHLFKFNKYLNSNYKVKEYKNINSKSKNEKRASLRIFNNHFCKTLYDIYGLCSHRTSLSKLHDKIPTDLIKHFIRGLIDSNGSFCEYRDHYNKRSDIQFSFSSRSLELHEFIQDYFLVNGLIKRKTKIYDGRLNENGAFGLHFKGVRQIPNILEHLYKDSSIYLDRKYDTYIEIMNLIKEGGYNSRQRYNLLVEST